LNFLTSGILLLPEKTQHSMIDLMQNFFSGDKKIKALKHNSNASQHKRNASQILLELAT
jgi:hypothetical protein